MLLKTNKVWLTSDTHYNHENICKTTTSWNINELNEDHAGYRDFDSLQLMNELIVNSINKYVKKDDYLFHLGDWSFNGIESIFDFRKQIKCKNIHLILGNHDHHIENNKELPDVQQEEALKYLKCYLNKNVDVVKTQDLFNSVQSTLRIKVQKSIKQKAISIFMSHYSHRVWDKHYIGYTHAFGHSHGSLDYCPNGKSIDVGIDTAYKRYGEYRPYSAEEFIDIVNKQHFNIIDHHGN